MQAATWSGDAGGIASSAERVGVKYASEGGYSPGDTWELYVGTADGKPLRVFFSHVSIKLMGSDTWVNAE